MSKILIIDDNVLIGKMLNTALSEQGYDVRAALDANEGYAAAIEFEPDLILLDVQLPDVTGTDLIGIIKNRDDLRHIRIIMITGTHNQTEHKVKAFQAGADDYVLKPFEIPELLERIRAVLRRSVTRPAPEKRVAAISSTNVASKGPVDPPPQILSIPKAIGLLIQSPLEFPTKARTPGAAMPCLVSLVAVSMAGLAATAGVTIKPIIAGCAVIGVWGALVAVLVMVSSLLGISLTWKDGSNLISLAGFPVLMKMVGGMVSAMWTSLSPFYYTASPAIFLSSAPKWVERIDVFEIWTAFLLWILIRRRSGSSAKAAGIVTFVVWLAGLSMAAGLGKLGTG